MFEKALPHSVCVIKDKQLRRALKRTLKAAGTDVSFSENVDPQKQASILFIDQEARRNADIKDLIQVIGENGKLVVLGSSIEDDEVLSLLNHGRINHVISESATADECEILTTSVKLLSGDIFGLEKYLSWGSTISSESIRTYQEKRKTLLEVSAYAKHVGARRSLIRKIEMVADELLMNALYDAPATQNGITYKELVNQEHLNEIEPARIQWACDGRYFAVSVQDNYGELTKKMILKNLSRARSERNPLGGEDGEHGAGLGLFFILSSATRFIANIADGERTEVICLFDLKDKKADQYVRSLHIFDQSNQETRE